MSGNGIIHITAICRYNKFWYWLQNGGLDAWKLPQKKARTTKKIAVSYAWSEWKRAQIIKLKWITWKIFNGRADHNNAHPIDWQHENVHEITKNWAWVFFGMAEILVNHLCFCWCFFWSDQVFDYINRIYSMCVFLCLSNNNLSIYSIDLGGGGGRF